MISYQTFNQDIQKKGALLSIPSIGLNSVKIMDGTDSYVLNLAIGRFENTPLKQGNICLAAHNAGYRNNYFEKLNETSLGDSIFYQIDGITKQYEIVEKKQIDAYDWSVIENATENRMTLITCISNQPELRLCVIAREKGE